MNFLIQLKHAILQLRNGIFVQSLAQPTVTSASEISQNNANTTFFAILNRKRENFC